MLDETRQVIRYFSDKKFIIYSLPFLILSFLILIGIYFEVVTYGIDVQTPFMAAGIFIAHVLITIIRLCLRSLDKDWKLVLGIATIFLMTFLSFYYLLEDKFKIVFKY